MPTDAAPVVFEEAVHKPQLTPTAAALRSNRQLLVAVRTVLTLAEKVLCRQWREMWPFDSVSA
jgi:hypothetical protein